MSPQISASLLESKAGSIYDHGIVNKRSRIETNRSEVLDKSESLYQNDS